MILTRSAALTDGSHRKMALTASMVVLNIVGPGYNSPAGTSEHEPPARIVGAR